MEEKDLISSIAKVAQDTWRDEKRPVLISNIPRRLESSDFRSVLGEEGLKSFIKRTEAQGGYEIIQDPHLPARVGLLPAGQAYQFPVAAPKAVEDDKRKGETMLKFLDLLSELSEDEQRSVVIPVNVIAKLLQK